MGKFRLDTKKVVYYTVEIEAESVEDAEKMVKDWVDTDFEPFENSGTEWFDSLWIDVTEEDN